jgi:hypothetical protein
MTKESCGHSYWFKEFWELAKVRILIFKSDMCFSSLSVQRPFSFAFQAGNGVSKKLYKKTVNIKIST